MRFKKFLLKSIVMSVAAIIMLSGCGSKTSQSTSSLQSISSENGSSSKESSSSKSASFSTSAASSSNTTNTNNASSSSGSFDSKSVPTYSGDPVYVVNNNIPYFSDSDKSVSDGYETYSDLDSLGRCGVAYAKIGQDTMPTKTRGYIGSVRPSGWHTTKYNDIIDGNYLYNRCHLIGYQLAGENANEKNLITGTRYLNVTGMLPYENLVADYVHAKNGHVFYRVTPYYSGNNLVADGVLMEGQSQEDNGVQFCVWVYNVQPGVVIDYATGDSHEEEGYTGGKHGNELPKAINNGIFTPRDASSYGSADSAKNWNTSNKKSSDNSAGQTYGDGHDYNGKNFQSGTGTTYVINTNTKKFHRPTCPSIQKMSQKNTEETTKSKEELEQEGYSPCGICKP